AETGVTVCVGMAEEADGTVYNSAVVVGGTGPVANFRKLQLYGPAEKARYTPGDALVVFEFLGFKIGLLICYDIEFPELFRPLARAGADLVLAPTANMTPFDNVNRLATSARAMDHGLSLAYCNYCGVEGNLTYLGRSVIAGPDGDPIALAGLETTLLIADIPKAKDFKHRALSSYLEDQREITKLTDGTSTLRS
ncbi:MAG: nitrilase-related carbon-nitrogen hydrolase, partial [Pseudomonadota bacterium]